MEYRSLDLTIISADDIKDVNFFSKMSVYVVVSLLSQAKTKKKTHVHKKCGSSPRWNHRMKFAIHEPSLSDPAISFLFQLKCDSLLRGSKDIGEVCVHLQELFNGNGDDDTIEKVVDYQVRTPSGKPKGTFKFSYKFGEKFSQQQQQESNKKTHPDESVTAYPAATPTQEGSPAYPTYPSYGYAAPPPPGYPSQQHGGYPPMGYGGYPVGAQVYPPAPGYGYQPPPPMGYVYPPPMQHVQPHNKKSRMGGGGGLGMGLAGGLLGGLVLGEMVSDIGEMAAYNDAMGMDGF